LDGAYCTVPTKKALIETESPDAIFHIMGSTMRGSQCDSLPAPLLRTGNFKAKEILLKAQNDFRNHDHSGGS